MLPRSAILFLRTSKSQWRTVERFIRVPMSHFSSNSDNHKTIRVESRITPTIQHNGFVILNDIDGIFYSGQVLNGSYNGKGTCTKHQHETYTGDFVDGKRCGYGKTVYHKRLVDLSVVPDTVTTDVVLHAFGSASVDKANTDNLVSYEGDWKDDKYHGHGLLKFKHGSQYDGSFVEGIFQGSAEYKFENGDVYVGMFHDDTACGRGKFTKLDGDCYVGDFTNGVFHGFGKYDMNNDMSYEGEWQDGEMHGEGRLFSRAHDSVNLFKGRFEHGEFIQGEGPPPDAVDDDQERENGDDEEAGNVETQTVDLEKEGVGSYTEEDLAADLRRKEIVDGDGFSADVAKEGSNESGGDEEGQDEEEGPEETLTEEEQQLAMEMAEELKKIDEEHERKKRAR